jgi:acetylornithine deacetylase/succinyl-diaminopimelate desuccinylase-like protein
MAEAVKRVSNYQPPRDTSIIKRFLEGAGVGGIRKWLITKQWLLPRMLKVLSRRSIAQAKFFHALSQMTMSPNLCQSGTKVNIVPGSAEVQLDIRTLPGQDEDYVIEHLKKALGHLSKEIEIQELGSEEGGFSSIGTMSDPESELVDLLKTIIRETKDEEADLIPMVSPGGTDARILRQAFGTNAYGFNLISDDMDANEIVRMIHGDNERVSLSTLDETGKAYYEIAKRFLS